MTNLPAIRADILPPTQVIGTLIEKAVDSKAAVEVVKELRAMWHDDLARKAEAEFDAAMKAFQAECPPIEKVKKGGVAPYAPLDHIEMRIKPLKDKFGFNHSFDTEESPKGTVTVVIEVCHVGGHKRKSKVTMPLPDKTRAMNDSQQHKAAISYGKRAAVENAYNVVVVGEDTDCSTPQKPAGPAKATQKTLEWMIQQLSDIEDKAVAYAIDMGWIMPDEWLEQWPLEQVPTSKRGLDNLRSKIEDHQ